MPATTRRAFLPTAGAAAGTAFVPRWLDAAPKLRLTGCELLPVRASDRTVWLIVGLRTDVGLTGLGEASDAFGCANTTREDAARMETELRGLFELVKGAIPARRGELSPARAWDLAGKALEVPASTFFGGAVRDRLPVDANVNRATNPRTPEGFAASARGAVRDGFRALKAAPWDGFPPAGSPAARIEAAVQAGTGAAQAERRDVLQPAEQFVNGSIAVPTRPGFGVELNERVVRAHPI